MLKRRKKNPGSRIAIDPGAYRTRFYSATEGLLLDQPSIAALDMDHPLGGASSVSAFGEQAAEILMNGVDGYREVKPVQSDIRNDLGLRSKMLGYFLDHARRSGLTGEAPEISLLLPHHCDAKTSARLQQTCHAAGAVKVDVQDASLAAFYSTGLDKSESCVMIDFGATASRLIAVANAEVVHCQSLIGGGDAIDKAIIAGLLARFELQITSEGARHIKHNIAAATRQSFVQCTRNSCQVNCLSVKTNTMREFRVSSDTISEILQPVLDELTHSIRLAFGAIDSTIKDAAYENGIRLYGGGAMLPRIDQLVMAATDLPVEVVKRPLTWSARGAASTMIDQQSSVELIDPHDLAPCTI